ncbi:uncharacterized protein CcaverHIS019_0406940 [Cutaneotrichosporon cavernicola]|uniref:JmjC domain-containing protein n=1 Tax=Cutaneotrichosporon cavernicola TaxID=279322 RepID=A0AA48QVZ2_9TREE|nr:uncharacterized protein CcaverHIS019_0406940 [Cutaneotrichosporon cavernicola]BEI91874.1 hypothetical protein CcaverHIS019_0406940 [Cutaneotrichosporon cavernicola]BEI99646.1 hypothetical protein CcaverHIS631_0406890 [Cutaneotrichosporon cavernicola]
MPAAALRAHISASGGPLRLPGIAWRLERWSAPDLGTLRDDVGEHTAVDVEIAPRGRGYTDPAWQRVTMGFGLFLDAFVLGRIPAADPALVPVGYLAQAPLLDLPGLRDTLPPLEHYVGPRGDVYGRTLWVGPRGSFTPFHRDPNVGLYTQVIGSKVFHLLPPDIKFQTSAVRANTATVPISVRRIFGEQGEGDGEGEDVTPIEKEQLRTLLGEAFERDGACEVRLGPGDSLLIPPGWWHSAEGESVGVGVNAWFR